MSDFGHIAALAPRPRTARLGALPPPLSRSRPGLRDRGLTLAKPFALLLFIYPVWFVAALGLPLFTATDPGRRRGSCWRSRLGASPCAQGRQPGRADEQAQPARLDLLAFLRGSWRYVVLSEVIFIGGFLFYIWLRSYNPQILGTEKPMEMGFLSAATRDTTLPPRDPWLSGYGINYYYLGFVLSPRWRR